MSFAKIFDSIYGGTLADNWQGLVTFQQMLVLADANGIVDMTPSAIYRTTGIPLEIIEAGIAFLESPDRQSRTPTMEGKRIARMDEHRTWGWFIVNYEQYRQRIAADEKRERDRIRIAEKRAKSIVSQPVADCSGESQMVADVAQAEADVEAVKQEPLPRSANRGSRLPEDWQPTDEQMRWAREARTDVDAKLESEKFRDYWHAKAGRDGCKRDWEATWRNWIRNAKGKTFSGSSPPKPSAHKLADPPKMRTTGEERKAALERLADFSAKPVGSQA